MGVFYNRLLESVENDVEKAIQTPDDVGVDLDAIEDAIVGKDGIEAHRNEVEAAEEGVVGDPLEEAATIMYESEYNFNQLMKCIGIAELNEMAAGRDFVLEAGSENSASFWEKTKQLFTRMFESITKVFHNVVSKIGSSLPSDKKFVEKYEDVIRKGAASSEAKFKNFYNFSKLMQLYTKRDSKLKGKFDAAISNPNWTKDGDSAIANAAIIADVAPNRDIQAADTGEFAAKLKSHFFVEEEYGNNAVNTVIQILKRDEDVKNLRKAYAELKAQYAELFKYLKEMKATFDKKTEDGALANSVCIAYISAHKYEKNLQNIYFTTVLKAHKTARAQARHMAMKWYHEGKGKKNDKKEESTSKNESAFLNINII